MHYSDLQIFTLDRSHPSWIAYLSLPIAWALFNNARSARDETPIEAHEQSSLATQVLQVLTMNIQLLAFAWLQIYCDTQ